VRFQKINVCNFKRAVCVIECVSSQFRRVVCVISFQKSSVCDRVCVISFQKSSVCDFKRVVCVSNFRGIVRPKSMFPNAHF